MHLHITWFDDSVGVQAEPRLDGGDRPLPVWVDTQSPPLVAPTGATCAEQGNAVDTFGPEPMRISMLVWASAQLIAVVRRPYHTGGLT
jgi:hypothetical protein